MARSERRLAPTQLILIALISLGLLCAASWIGWKVYSDSHSVCGRWPLASSVVPAPEGFEIKHSVSLSPEGCGADFKRQATLATTSDTDQQPLDRYVSVLIAEGWLEVDCAMPAQRCLDDGRHFVSIAQAERVLVVSVQPSSHT